MTDREQFIDVLNRIDRAKTFASGWHGNMRRWRRLYDGKHYDTPAAKAEVRYVDPTYENAVDLATGIMLGNQLVWKAQGWKPSLLEQMESSYVEKYMNGAWFVNSEREEKNLLYEAFLNFNRDGGAAIYSVWDGDIARRSKQTMQIPDGEAPGGTRDVLVFTELPLRIQVIDPLSMFMLPGGPKRWICIGRTESKTVLDVENTYGVRLSQYRPYSDEQKSLMRGEFVDYWDYAYLGEGDERRLVVRNAVLFDGEYIPGFELREMPGYEDLPYTVQFFKPTSSDNSKNWHSLIQPLEGSVSLMERSINRRQRQIDVYSSLPIVTKTHPGRVVSIDPGLGKSVNISTDEDIGFPQWPGNAPDVQYQIDFYHSRIQQSGFSDVMYGSGPTQVTGYALSQLGDQNRIRLTQPIEHMQLLLTSWARKALKICAHFARGAYTHVYGSMRGVDFMDRINLDEARYVMVRAEIRPNFPNEEVRKHAMGTQTAGTLSTYTRMEKYFGIEQPDEEMKRVEIEKAMQHPVFQMYSIIHELNERAKDGDEVAAMTLQAVQQGNMMGGNQEGSGTPNPEQLMGVQSPTGEAIPQAGGAPPYGQGEADIINNMANAAPGMDGST